MTLLLPAGTVGLASTLLLPAGTVILASASTIDEGQRGQSASHGLIGRQRGQLVGVVGLADAQVPASGGGRCLSVLLRVETVPQTVLRSGRQRDRSLFLLRAELAVRPDLLDEFL